MNSEQLVSQGYIPREPFHLMKLVLEKIEEKQIFLKLFEFQ